MHETSQNKLVKLVPKLGVQYYYDDGAPLYYTPHGKAGPQFKAKKVADEFADYCDWFYKNDGEAEDRSVDDFVREFVKNHELITDDERLWAPQATREVGACLYAIWPWTCLSANPVDRALDRYQHFSRLG